MPGTTTATWRAVVRSPNTSAARPSPAGSKSRKWRSGSSSSRSLRRRASSSETPVGAQARDLAVDRLGVGGVAQRDRRAVEVADQLRPLVGERVGDVRVETLEERRDSGRIGAPRDHALEVLRGALRPPARSTLGPRRRPRTAPAIWQTARAASSAIRRAGPATTSALDDHRDEQQHADVLGGDLSALPSQHHSRVPRGGAPAPEARRPNFPAGTGPQGSSRRRV